MIIKLSLCSCSITCHLYRIQVSRVCQEVICKTESVVSQQSSKLCIMVVYGSLHNFLTSYKFIEILLRGKKHVLGSWYNIVRAR